MFKSLGHSMGVGLRRFRLPALFSFILFWIGCGITGPDLDTRGQIGFWEGEGGCWSIATSTENFHPIDLQEEFKVVGLQVRFTAERRKNINTFCPGKVIELEEISRAN